MTSEINRYYRALELEPGASLEQVKQAWRELVKVWHPDRFPNDPKLQRKAQERLKEINGAYEILERYLTSGTPPPHGRSASSQTANRSQQQSSERRESESARGETPPRRPPPSPPPTSSEDTGSERKRPRGAVVWAVAGGFVTLLLTFWLLILAASGHKSRGPSTSGSSSFGTNKDGFEIVVPRVSMALDEKNGFKDFKFGMTPHEARKVLPPNADSDGPGLRQRTFLYGAKSVNRIGDYPVDLVKLIFFEDRLYESS